MDNSEEINEEENFAGNGRDSIVTNNNFPLIFLFASFYFLLTLFLYLQIFLIDASSSMFVDPPPSNDEEEEAVDCLFVQALKCAVITI